MDRRKCRLTCSDLSMIVGDICSEDIRISSGDGSGSSMVEFLPFTAVLVYLLCAKCGSGQSVDRPVQTSD